MKYFPTARQRYRIGHRWARANGLSTDITNIAGVNHDWLHAELELGPLEEGLVHAAEECIAAKLVITEEFYGDLALELTVQGDDWCPSRVAAVWPKLLAILLALTGGA